MAYEEWKLMNTDVHFSSKTDMWETPQYFFDELDKEFHFTTDACAVSCNAKCQHYYSPEEDSLKQKWSGTVYMNPPYSRQMGK
jgi:phage N-6-adenine-methyltransferase